MLLKDKVAVVTGGGAGLGKAIVRQYLAEGAYVIATDVRQDRLDALQAEMNAGGRLYVLQSDVSKKEDNQAVLDYAVRQLGRVDILVNNAGISEGMLPTDEVSDELWERMLAIDLTGPFQLCRGALRIMLEKEIPGSIVNVASAAGVGGGRGGASYTAAKHGLIGLTKNIAYMYGPKGIRCNAICPGYVPTEIASESYETSAYGMQRVSAGTKPIRPGRPEEIADLAVYLASDKSSLINGVAILADAGKGAY